MKHDPEELNEIREELEGVIAAHRHVLNDEPRIRIPLEQSRDAAKVKYQDVAGHLGAVEKENGEVAAKP